MIFGSNHLFSCKLFISVESNNNSSKENSVNTFAFFDVVHRICYCTMIPFRAVRFFVCVLDIIIVLLVFLLGERKQMYIKIVIRKLVTLSVILMLFVSSSSLNRRTSIHKYSNHTHTQCELWFIFFISFHSLCVATLQNNCFLRFDIIIYIVWLGMLVVRIFFCSFVLSEISFCIPSGHEQRKWEKNERELKEGDRERARERGSEVEHTHENQLHTKR